MANTRRTFTFFGRIRGGIVRTRSKVRRRKDQLLNWFAEQWLKVLEQHGYRFEPEPVEAPAVVFNFLDPQSEKPKPFRRKSRATFVVGVLVEEELPEEPREIQKLLYPLLVRSLANAVVCVHPPNGHQDWRAWFVTPELGTYEAGHPEPSRFLDAVYDRLRPIINATLVIDNRFEPDLPEELWEGNERTRELARAGQRLDALGLLPAPFPLKELLTPAERRHLKRLYGIGGLSYGNLSAREPGYGFWMSASGVDKGRLGTVGRDILLIKDYDEFAREIVVSACPGVEPIRASVDAIEHWMIYHAHPGVQAIVHVHGWMEGVPVTQFNYPCGTVELARSVAELIAGAPDPAHAVVGLKNHGLTITGRGLDEIFDRIEGKISKYVPMD